MTGEAAIAIVRESDALSAHGATRITWRDDGLAIYETPSYGNFYFGNLFDLPSAPAGPDDVRARIREHRQHFAWRPRAAANDPAPAPDAPAVLRWCDPLGSVTIDSPYAVDERIGLTMVSPFGGLDVGALPAGFAEIAAGDDDAWQAIPATLLSDHPEQTSYLAWAAERARDDVRAGRARWYAIRSAALESGVAAPGTILSRAGIYRKDGLARFADVATLPEARGHGLATRLVAAMLASLTAGADASAVPLRAVIVAECNSQAERIYRALGFEPLCLQRAIVVGPEAEA